jgi:hypothetical protein
MRFKDWFLNNEDIAATGSVAASSMSGGIQDVPGDLLNTNLPVQSKISTKDGSSKPTPDAADRQRSAEKTFGFKSQADKNASRERQANWIDKNRRMVRVTNIPPDTI